MAFRRLASLLGATVRRTQLQQAASIRGMRVVNQPAGVLKTRLQDWLNLSGRGGIAHMPELTICAMAAQNLPRASDRRLMRPTEDAPAIQSGSLLMRVSSKGR